MKSSNSATKPKSVIKDPDDALQYVGELGLYQIRLVLMFSVFVLVGGYPTLIMYFAGHNPPWKCSDYTICTLNGTLSSEDVHYKDRCSMPRSAWKFTKPKEYSIVTQVDSLSYFPMFIRRALAVPWPC